MVNLVLTTDAEARERQRVAINLIIDADIKQKLRELAAEDRRSMTLELEFLVEEAWRARKGQK